MNQLETSAVRIFISYRRQDEPFAAGRIYTDLCEKYGADNIFKDVDNIPPGAEFRRLIFDEIDKCQVFLAVIGERWRAQKPDGLYRILEKEDYIRLETESALKNGLYVIPVLIGETDMPNKADIPEEIHGLLDRNAARLRVDPDWERDMEKLIKGLDGLSVKTTVRKKENSEEQLWKRAEKASVIKRYKAYLDLYPSGKYAQQATEKIQSIREQFIKPDNSLEETLQHEEPDKVVEPNFVEVPGGSFVMGDFSVSDEAPPHQVELWGFNISSTQITVAEYKCFCIDTNKSMPSPPSWGWRDEHPMVNVTWHEAQAYCEWLGGRLPTETEWEFVAKAGLETGEVFQLESDLFWDKSNSKGKTAPVGKKPPNSLGLHDLLGNVWEWCYDYYGPYSKMKKVNPRGPMNGLTKVVRGGSFEDALHMLSVTRRMELFPDHRASNVGFRVVKESEEI